MSTVQMTNLKPHRHGPNCNHGPQSDLWKQIMKLYMIVEDKVMSSTKYFFYVLVVVLYPCSF